MCGPHKRLARFPGCKCPSNVCSVKLQSIEAICLPTSLRCCTYSHSGLTKGGYCSVHSLYSVCTTNPLVFRSNGTKYIYTFTVDRSLQEIKKKHNLDTILLLWRREIIRSA